MGTRMPRLPRSLPLVLVLLAASCGGRPFSSQEWKSGIAAGRTGSAMVGMARTLEKERTLIGKTRPEVIALLGEGHAPRGSGGNDRDLTWLIDEFPFMMSVTIFAVCFDGNGKVIEARILEQGV